MLDIKWQEIERAKSGDKIITKKVSGEPVHITSIPRRVLSQVNDLSRDVIVDNKKREIFLQPNTQLSIPLGDKDIELTCTQQMLFVS